MRLFCYFCVKKHISQAWILHNEFMYDTNNPSWWKIIGHLTEASEEILQKSPDLAKTIRNHRLELMQDPLYQFPFEDLIRLVTEIEQAELSKTDPPEINVPVLTYTPKDLQEVCLKLTQATILDAESRLGYPEHRFLALARLQEALETLPISNPIYESLRLKIDQYRVSGDNGFEGLEFIKKIMKMNC